MSSEEPRKVVKVEEVPHLFDAASSTETGGSGYLITFDDDSSQFILKGEATQFVQIISNN